MTAYHFLQAILPSTGRYCLLQLRGKFKAHHWCEDLETLAAKALELASTDVYFAMASFGAEDSRTAENAVLLKSFFVDLDCGEGKPYADKSEAVTALRAFCKETKLPRPLVVDSGGGIHAYWPLEKALPKDQWLPLARSLKILCLSRGLEIDRAVTTDMARVLRVPGTYNYKQQTPRDVVQLNEVSPFPLERITDCLPPPPVDLSAARIFKDEITSGLGAVQHKPSKFKVIMLRSAAEGQGCAQLRKAYVDQATLEEPLWRAALSIATNCTDRNKAIHRLSEQHPDYKPEETEAKAERLIGKPYTCQWYRDNYPEGCAGCTQRITSPIQIGVTVEETPVEEDGSIRLAAPQSGGDESDPMTITVVEDVIPPIPHPYFRGAQGGIYMKVRPTEDDPAPEPLLVCERDIYLTERYYDIAEDGSGDGEMYAANIRLPSDATRQFPLRMYDIASPDRLRDALSKHGVLALGKQAHYIMNYFATTIRAIQDKNAAGRTRDQLGWTQEDSFVLGAVEHRKEGGVRLAPPSLGLKTLVRGMRSRGSLDRWFQLMEVYRRPGMEAHAFAFLVGLGSPLLRLLDSPQVRGAVLNLTSPRSGTGKTTVLTMINSIWGHPTDLLMGQKDTTMAKFHMMGMLNNLPLTIDEITNATPEDLSQLVYGATSGRASHRMEAQSNKLRNNNTSWCSFTITSSNAAVSQALVSRKAAAEGELKRVIDLPIDMPSGISKEESDSLFQDLADNYGVFGPRFVQYVTQHQDDIKQALKLTQRNLDRAFDFQQNDRFYSAVVACAVVAGNIAKALGAPQLATKRMMERIQELLGEVKAENTDLLSASAVDLESTLSALGGYLNARVSSTLIIEKAHANKPMPAPILRPRDSIAIRYEPESQMLYLDAKDFQRYCVENRLNIKNLCKELSQAKLLKFYLSRGSYVTKKAMANGLNGNMPSPKVDVYAIKASAIPGLIDHVEGLANDGDDEAAAA